MPSLHGRAIVEAFRAKAFSTEPATDLCKHIALITNNSGRLSSSLSWQWWLFRRSPSRLPSKMKALPGDHYEVLLASNNALMGTYLIPTKPQTYSITASMLPKKQGTPNPVVVKPAPAPAPSGPSGLRENDASSSGEIASPAPIEIDLPAFLIQGSGLCLYASQRERIPGPFLLRRRISRVCARNRRRGVLDGNNLLGSNRLPM